MSTSEAPKPKKPKPRLNYPALKAEWFQSAQALKPFLVSKGISWQKALYNHIRGWQAEKDAIIAKSLEIAKGNAVKKWTEEWDVQMGIWQDVEGLAKEIMTKRREYVDGQELAALTAALERALKSQRLIMGESTENVTTKSYHMAVVQLMKERRNANPGPSNGV